MGFSPPGVLNVTFISLCVKSRIKFHNAQIPVPPYREKKIEG